MKTQTVDTPIDYENVEHISTILSRYLCLCGLHRVETDRDRSSKKHKTELSAIGTSQLEFADNFENLAEIETKPVIHATRC